jgi:hypothetical protein
VKDKLVTLLRRKEGKLTELNARSMQKMGLSSSGK